MIQASHLMKRFGSFTAVADVTLQVEPGQILALLGPNGAGKTTTIRMLASLLQPTAGSAIVAGYDTVRQPALVRQSVGLLTELPGLYSRMNAIEYLAFFGRLYPLAEDKLRAQAEHLLNYFGLWEDRNRAIGAYSKGMRQKVALARALLHSPAVVLLDEPTSAMDPASAKTVRDYIRYLREDRRTVLICTHNLAEAEDLADCIAIIKNGRIAVQGSSAQLKQRLLGSPLFEVRFGALVQEHPLPLNGLLTEVAWGADWLRYSTSDPGQANPWLIEHFVQAGAPVVSLSQVPQRLEAVYLQIVEEEPVL